MKCFLACLLLVMFSFGYGQVKTAARLEFDLKDGFAQEQVIPNSKYGFFLIARENIDAKNEANWKIDEYTSSLKLERTKTVSLKDAKYLSKFIWDDNYFYGLFSKSTFRRISRLVKIDKQTLEVTELEIEIPKKFSLQELEVVGEELIFAGSLKRKLFAFTVNTSFGNQSVLTIDTDNLKRSSVANITIANKKAFLFINDWQKRRKKNKYTVQVLDEYGKKEERFILNENKDFSLSNASVSYIKKDKSYCYTGTYSEKYKGLSQGLFFIKKTNDKVDFFKTYDFLSFKNFLNYLPEKKQKRIEKKKKRKEKKGKSFSVNYRMIGHDIIPYENQYVYVGEAYYPTYRTEFVRTTGANGQVTTTTRQVFDGYQYSHAVIAGFNKKGDLLWDQVIEMWVAYKPFYVKKFIKIQEENNESINMAFASGKYIKSISIDLKGEILNNTEEEIVETNTEGDKQKWTTSSMEYWYDNFFIMYGTQKIKNTKNSKVKRKRRIFYINKLQYN